MSHLSMYLIGWKLRNTVLLLNIEYLHAIIIEIYFLSKQLWSAEMIDKCLVGTTCQDWLNSKNIVQSQKPSVQVYFDLTPLLNLLILNQTFHPDLLRQSFFLESLHHTPFSSQRQQSLVNKKHNDWLNSLWLLLYQLLHYPLLHAYPPVRSLFFLFKLKF